LPLLFTRDAAITLLILYAAAAAADDTAISPPPGRCYADYLIERCRLYMLRHYADIRRRAMLMAITPFSPPL